MSDCPALPSELWAHVFAFTVFRPDDGGDLWIPDPSIHNAPLLLCRVSRQWRDIALQSSELWTSLGLDITELTLADGVLDGAQRWLARSQDRPLQLSLWNDGASLAVGNSFVERILAKHLHHVETLMIRMAGGGWPLSPDGEPSRWISPPALNELPLLKAVDLRFKVKDYVIWTQPIFRARLPALRRLDMADYTMMTDVYLPLEGNLKHITHLDIATNNYQYWIFWILEQCPHLAYCRLNFRMRLPFEPREHASSRPLVLPHLRTLILYVKRITYWRDVFAVSTFSALEELKVFGAIWPLPSFIPFLLRSQCRLRALGIENANISETELIPILRALSQNLESLSLNPEYSSQPPFERLPVGDTLIHALDPRHSTDSSSVLLPRLSRIEIDGRFAGKPPWTD
ncbi:hypothetical protein EXIGLDRAFT_780046, partial [Exidia glandulosa HHB12029]